MTFELGWFIVLFFIILFYLEERKVKKDLKEISEELDKIIIKLKKMIK